MFNKRGLFLVVGLLLLDTIAFCAPEIAFNGYHTVEEINAYMQAKAMEHPEFARRIYLGNSQQNREIYVLAIGKTHLSSLPGIYFNATHHGDEKSGTESLLALMDNLLRHLDSPSIQGLLNRYVIYLQPLVNPDGHAHNTRSLSTGLDPNRDYGMPTKKASAHSREKEVLLVKAFMEKARLRAAVALHSGMEGVLWPWGFSSQPTPEHNVFFTIAQNMARAMNVRLYQQSYYDYQTEGEFIDYVYWRYKALGFTVEVSEEATPSATLLPLVVNRFVKGAFTFLQNVDAYYEGQLSIKPAFDNDYLAAQ